MTPSPAAAALERELGFRLELRDGQWWLVHDCPHPGGHSFERRADLSEERMWLALLERARE